MNRTFGERALRFYLGAMRFFWRPIRGAALAVVRHPWRTTATVLGGLLLAFILKTTGVALAEGGAPVIGRVCIGLGGVADLVTTTFVGMVGAALLYWFLIAVGMVQIPVGEIMEVLRELGQMLRLQDPVKRDREGNIRAVDTEQLLAWGMLLLIVPGMALMSTAWLGVFPTWTVYAMLLLVTVGGLAYGVFAAVRGRRVGAGLDLLMGMNGYLVVGGIITLLYRTWLHYSYPLSVAVVDQGSMALAGHPEGLPWDRDWQLASYLATVAEHGGFSGVDVTAYPGALGAMLAIGFWGLVATVLHIVTVVSLVRILRRPPERERAAAAKADAADDAQSPAPASDVITAGNLRGPGLDWYRALVAAAPFALTAIALWFVTHYWVNEWTCRFGDTAWSFAAVCAGIAFAAALLRSRWPRAATALALVASVLLLVGYTRHVLDTWQHGAVACAAPVHRPEPPAAPPVPTATTTTTTAATSSGTPTPVPHAAPPPPRVDESGAIASYFAGHRTECPETAGRSWHRLRNARLACTAEAVRRD